jgi:hypothetical protein
VLLFFIHTGFHNDNFLNFNLKSIVFTKKSHAGAGHGRLPMPSRAESWCQGPAADSDRPSISGCSNAGTHWHRRRVPLRLWRHCHTEVGSAPCSSHGRTHPSLHSWPQSGNTGGLGYCSCDCGLLVGGRNSARTHRDILTRGQPDPRPMPNAQIIIWDVERQARV